MSTSLEHGGPSHLYKEIYGLPTPERFITDPSKKSHAKKQPKGHIPKARNPFVLFRCNLVGQKIIPTTSQTDHRDVSKIAGIMWREMTEEERRPWIELGEEEKANHERKYGLSRQGNYSDNSRQKSKGSLKRHLLDGEKRTTKRGDDIPMERQFDTDRSLPSEDLMHRVLHRSESAPPGPIHTPHATVERMELESQRRPTKTRDDLSRRPSRVIVYVSSREDGMYGNDGELVFQIPPEYKVTQHNEASGSRNLIEDGHNTYLPPGLFEDFQFDLFNPFDQSQAGVDFLGAPMNPQREMQGYECNPPIFRDPFMGVTQEIQQPTDEATAFDFYGAQQDLFDISYSCNHLQLQSPQNIFDDIFYRRLSSDLLAALEDLPVPSLFMPFQGHNQ